MGWVVTLTNALWLELGKHPGMSPSYLFGRVALFSFLCLSCLCFHDSSVVVCLFPNRAPPSLSLSSVGTVLLYQANQEGSSLLVPPVHLYILHLISVKLALFVLWYKSESNHLPPCKFSPLPLHHPPFWLSVGNDVKAYLIFSIFVASTPLLITLPWILAPNILC